MGEVFGAIMMSSLVKGLGRLMALLTQLRHGERTMGSLGRTRERLAAGNGGSCFLKLLTGGKDAAGAVARRERGDPGIGSRPMLVLPARELRLGLEQSQVHLRGRSSFPVPLSR